MMNKGRLKLIRKAGAGFLLMCFMVSVLPANALLAQGQGSGPATSSFLFLKESPMAPQMSTIPLV
jgi:hypothetical protein